MHDHIDAHERRRWNAFKKAYRESHPTKIRNHQYHKHVRALYKTKGVPNLEPWLKMSALAAAEPLPALHMSEKDLLTRLHLAKSNMEFNARKPLTDEELAQILRWKEHLSNMGQTRLAALSDQDLMEVYEICEYVQRIHEEIGESAQLIQQLRDYLLYLRHNSNCPPHVLSQIQNEVFKLTLI